MKKSKKILASLLVALLLVTSVSVLSFADGEKITTYNAKDNLTQYVCTTQKTTSTDGLSETLTNTYDSKGNLIKRIDSYKTGDGYSGTGVTTNSYDTKGNLIKIVYSFKNSLDPLNPESSTRTYSYDSRNNLIKEVFSYKIGNGYSCTDTINYTYDSKGNLIKAVESYKDSDENSNISTTINSYDSKNNLIKKVYSSKNKTETTETVTTTFSYDTKGNLLKKVCSNKDSSGNSSTETRTNTYDSKGNLTKEVYSYKNGNGESSTETRTNTYDSKSNLTKEVYSYKNRDGELITTTSTNTYDSKGNLLKAVCSSKNSNGESSTTTITKTYDSKGNLLKKVTSSKSNGESSSTETTTNTYDSKSNLLKEVNSYNRSDGYLSTQTRTYTYDSHGNKIKETYSSKDSDGESSTKTTTNTYKKLSQPVCIVDDMIHLSDYSYNYDGKAKKPTVKMQEAFQNKEYKVEYKNNINPGTAQVIINFLNGGFYGVEKVTINFEIKNALAPVTGLKASKVTANSASLAWNNVSGAKYYKVYQSTDGKKWTALATVTANSYTVKNLKAGTKYQFCVRGLDSTKKYSSSTYTPVKISTLTPAPKASKVTTTAIALTWTKISGAKYYKVEQSTDGKTWKVLTSTATTNSYTVKNLKSGAKYQYRVTALDSTKKLAGKTSTVLKTGTLTVAPSVTLKSTKSKTATASWKKVAGASSYVVYKSTDGKKWTKVGTTTGTSCNLTKLSAGKKIYVKVYAVNGYKLNSAASKTVSVTVKK